MKAKHVLTICGELSLAISILFLVIWIAEGRTPDAWAYADIAKCCAWAALIQFVFSFTLGEVERRESMLPIDEYAKAKKRLRKRLRAKQRYGRISNQELRQERAAFILKAEELGIYQDTAAEDFEIIRLEERKGKHG